MLALVLRNTLEKEHLEQHLEPRGQNSLRQAGVERTVVTAHQAQNQAQEQRVSASPLWAFVPHRFLLWALNGIVECLTASMVSTN